MGTSGLHKGPRKHFVVVSFGFPARLTMLSHTEWDGRVATQTISPLIAIKDPREHLRRRKPWNRALSVASVKDFEPFVYHRAQQLVNELAGHKGPANLAQWFSWFTYVFFL